MSQKRLFTVSAFSYIISGASIIPMGIGDISGKNGSAHLAIISGVVFWLSLINAIITQFILRVLQKPYRKKKPLLSMILSPPTFWLAVVFILSLLTVILFYVFNINSIVVYIVLFIMLSCLELSILTAGKFRYKDRKLSFITYRSSTSGR